MEGGARRPGGDKCSGQRGLARNLRRRDRAAGVGRGPGAPGAGGAGRTGPGASRGSVAWGHLDLGLLAPEPGGDESLH